MILTCPECSAKYMVASESLGEHGRDVRCAKCGHTWHQKSEKDSLDDLISRIQSEEMDDIDFGDAKKFVKENTVREPLKLKLVRLINKPVNKVRSRVILVKSRLSKKFITRLAGGIVAGTIAYGMVYLGFMGLHNKLVAIYPPFQTVYDRLDPSGAEGEIVDINNSLALENVSMQNIDGKKILKGSIINLTSKDLPFPAIRLELAGEAHPDEESSHQKSDLGVFSIGEGIIAGESQHAFMIALDDKISAQDGKIDMFMVPSNKQTQEHPTEAPSSASHH